PLDAAVRVHPAPKVSALPAVTTRKVLPANAFVRSVQVVPRA
ncbi:hypothetical protein MTO96_051837, partial [Rhipicephalus appendiculatus]